MLTSDHGWDYWKHLYSFDGLGLWPLILSKPYNLLSKKDEFAKDKSSSHRRHQLMLHRISRLNVPGFDKMMTRLEDLKGRTRSKGDWGDWPNTLR